MDKVWEIKDPDACLRPAKTKRTAKDSPPPDEKDPAVAYSLSLWVWGLGQWYTGDRRKALLFLSAQCSLVAAVVLAVLGRTSLLQFTAAHQVPLAPVFLLAELLLICIVMFWMHNAGDAYHAAARMRTTRFPGTTSRALPFLASLLLPGWGQFLNGQPVKGSILSGFTVFGLFSLISIPAVLYSWPLLRPSAERLMIEQLFAMTVLYAPFLPLLWIFGSYDALAVSSDELKKESLWERIKAAYYRCRTQGFFRGVFPRLRSTMVLLLCLAGLGFLVSRFFPAGYYRAALTSLQTLLYQQGMTVVPELVESLLFLMSQIGK